MIIPGINSILNYYLQIFFFTGYKFIQYYLLNNSSEAFGIWIEFSWTNWSPTVPLQHSTVQLYFVMFQEPAGPKMYMTQLQRPFLPDLWHDTWNILTHKTHTYRHCLLWQLITYTACASSGESVEESCLQVNGEPSVVPQWKSNSRNLSRPNHW